MSDPVSAMALPLENWRDFYVLIGTSSGAILGATFIVVTLTANVEHRVTGIRGFISPTAVHLATVLIGSAILAIPALDRLGAALLLGCGGIAGAIYGAVVAGRIWNLGIGTDDRLWYVLIPIFAYLALAVAAAMLWLAMAPPLYIVAGSLIVLLIAGMRNAWDMASYMMLRDSGEDRR